MGDFSTQILRSSPRQVLIAAAGPIIGTNDLLETAASAVYPAANRALYYPIIIDQPVTVTQMWCHNGATVKGKVDLGIYDAAFNRIVNKGLTAQAGENTIQLLDIADTLLMPGLYYFAITSTSAEATFFRGTAAAVRQRAGGVSQKTLAGEEELPATVSTTAPASAFVPLFGASLSDAAVI